jgi:heme-degrading monooxygenase HmoA
MYMLLIDGVIKQGKQDEFLKTWSNQILPLLKKQNGFVDEILLLERGTNNAATGLSFWKTQQDAERYQRDVFPQAASNVEPLLDGFPTVRSFEVAASETFRIVAGKAA